MTNIYLNCKAVPIDYLSLPCLSDTVRYFVSTMYNHLERHVFQRVRITINGSIPWTDLIKISTRHLDIKSVIEGSENGPRDIAKFMKVGRIISYVCIVLLGERSP